mgnify:CR=1 FL=1
MIDAKTVILAIGRERRKLNLENEDDWTGKGVSYCSTCVRLGTGGYQGCK